MALLTCPRSLYQAKLRKLGLTGASPTVKKKAPKPQPMSRYQNSHLSVTRIVLLGHQGVDAKIVSVLNFRPCFALSAEELSMTARHFVAVVVTAHPPVRSHQLRIFRSRQLRKPLRSRIPTLARTCELSEALFLFLGSYWELSPSRRGIPVSELCCLSALSLLEASFPLLAKPSIGITRNNRNSPVLR